MTKFVGARRCMVAMGCAALVFGFPALPPAGAETGSAPYVTLPLPLPLPSGDGGEETPVPPVPSDEPTVEPNPEPTDGTGTVPPTDTVETPPPLTVPGPGTPPVGELPAGQVPNPAQDPSGQVPSGTGQQSDPFVGPQVQLPVLPTAPAPSPEEVVAPVVGADETASASPTPTPSTSATSTPSPSATAVPLPQQASKTIDAVVTAATGSPLYVQALTVLALVGLGVAYFRFMGAKRTRASIKSAK